MFPLLLILVQTLYGNKTFFHEGREYKEGANILLEKELKKGIIKSKLKVLMNEEELDVRLYHSLVFKLKGVVVGVGKQRHHFGSSPLHSLFVRRESPPLPCISFSTKSLCIFFAHLGDERKVKGAKLLGSRLSFEKGSARLSAFRMIIFGGEGGAQIKSLKDAFIVLSGENIEPDTNQIAGLELFIKRGRSSFYIQWGGEDEAGYLPSKPALLVGATIKRERSSIVLELAYFQECWYRHHLYRSGYTYKGEVIGHPAKRPEDVDTAAIYFEVNKEECSPYLVLELIKKGERTFLYGECKIKKGRFLLSFGRREATFFSLSVKL